MTNKQQLEDILKQEIARLEEQNKQLGRLPLIQTIFDKLDGDFYNFITLSSADQETLSSVFEFEEIHKIIRRAIVLSTNKAGINNIAQFKQYQDSMNDLKNVYALLEVHLKNNSINEIDSKNILIEQYKKLLKATNGNNIDINSVSIPFILEVLDKLKLDINEENIILLDLIISSLHKVEAQSFDNEDQILSEDEQNVFDLAEELLEQHKDEIRLFVGEMQYAGYITMLEQNLEDSIEDPEIKSKIELVKLSKYINDIKDLLEWYKSIPEFNTNERNQILENIEEIIQKIKPLIVKKNKEEKTEDKYKLIFFDSAKEDFHSDSLTSPGYKKQMTSILSELRNGDFKTEVRVVGTPRNLKRKKKLKVRICYIPLSNNLILIFSINNREQLGESYTIAINRLNSNLKAIDSIIEQSKIEEGLTALIRDSEEINKELDLLIEDRNKSIEGGTHEK